MGAALGLLYFLQEKIVSPAGSSRAAMPTTAPHSRTPCPLTHASPRAAAGMPSLIAAAPRIALALLLRRRMLCMPRVVLARIGPLPLWGLTSLVPAWGGTPPTHTRHDTAPFPHPAPPDLRAPPAGHIK